MARRKRSKRGSTYEPQAMRGHLVTATTLPRVVRSPSITIEPIQDRRLLPHAIRDEIYRTDIGTPAKISVRPTRADERKVHRVPPRMYHRFETPRRVPVCVRREDRRRVLFALRKSGKASARSRRANWTAKSYIRCK